ncbi:uncharacterized protein M6B38_195840 [Iris pallida]|uniref:Ribosomal protein L20 n=1 Tax=Iris pallida TaxID=29817 RepID=A0AAX6ECD7_IRIPA|nr:uncharacterized protein M6B38_195840 [Iris pallida]
MDKKRTKKIKKRAHRDMRRRGLRCATQTRRVWAGSPTGTYLVALI